jgi:hypothetical protein
MARIVRFYQLDGPEVLKIEETPSKQPGKGKPDCEFRQSD